MQRAMTVGLCALAISLFAWGATRGDDPPKKKAPAETQELLMRRKLTHAQNILEGLALGDFKKIQTGADELAVLRQKAEWMAIKTNDYQLFTNEFQQNIESLQKAAKAKNIDAATLAYVDMTLTCVRCHSHVREVRTAHNLAAPLQDNTPARIHIAFAKP
jgi:hypothetical protein